MTELPVFFYKGVVVIYPCFTHSFSDQKLRKIYLMLYASSLHAPLTVLLSHHLFGNAFVTSKMMSSTESNKRSWLIQLNDMSDSEIDTVMQNLWDESGEANIDNNINYATVAMYAG